MVQDKSADKTKSVAEQDAVIPDSLNQPVPLGKTKEEKDEQAKSLNGTDKKDEEAHEAAVVGIVH